MVVIVVEVEDGAARRVRGDDPLPFPTTTTYRSDPQAQHSNIHKALPHGHRFHHGKVLNGGEGNIEASGVGVH